MKIILALMLIFISSIALATSMTQQQSYNSDAERDTNQFIFHVKSNYKAMIYNQAQIENNRIFLNSHGVNWPGVNWANIDYVGAVNWTQYGVGN